MAETYTYRSIFVSDFHLGTKDSKAELLLDFLRTYESDYLYLVGDVVDGWALKRSWHWPQMHNDVIQKVLRKVRKGTRVTYLPGNHDEAVRHFLGLQFGGIAITDETLHTTADGRRFLVLHGDQFDGVVRYAKWLQHLGAQAYNVALTLNRWFNVVRRRMGLPYWSLSAYLKLKAKRAVQFIDNFEQSLAGEARNRGVDGIICGHIHHAELTDVDGIVYANTGDWVESCTALVEHHDGTLEILRFADTGLHLAPKVTETHVSGDGHTQTPELVLS